MPTINPRVNVTLSPSLDGLVRRMAVHQRVSKSQVLRELLEAAEPALRRAVAAMDLSQQARNRVLAHVAQGLELEVVSIEDELQLLLVDAQPELDLDGKVQERRPSRGRGEVRGASTPRPSMASAGGPNPPSSNRGVKSGGNAEKDSGTRSPVRVIKGGRA
jgi:hypothetical protein